MDGTPLLDVSVAVLHILGCIGFVVVTTMGLVTLPVRNLWAKVFKNFPTWAKMIACPMCFGVWGGAAWGALLFARGYLPGWVRTIHDVLAFAFTVSLIGFLVALFDHGVGGLGSIKDIGKHRPGLFRRRSW